MNDLLGDPVPEMPAMNAPLPWRVFEINDLPEWWVARTLGEAKLSAGESWGDTDPDLVQDAFELSEEALNTLMFTDEDEDNEGRTVKRTFREELDRRIAAGLSAPEVFACVE